MERRCWRPKLAPADYWVLIGILFIGISYLCLIEPISWLKDDYLEAFIALVINAAVYCLMFVVQALTYDDDFPLRKGCIFTSYICCSILSLIGTNIWLCTLFYDDKMTEIIAFRGKNFRNLVTIVRFIATFELCLICSVPVLIVCLVCGT